MNFTTYLSLAQRINISNIRGAKQKSRNDVSDFFLYLRKLMSMTQLVLHIENKSVATSLKKVLATMDGVTISSAKDLSAYEKSKMEARSGKVNTYSSVDELFAKVGL